SSLRKALPRVQLIASTHDPLCLRGLRSGEVAVLRRGNDGRIFSVEDLPPIEGLRAEDLLTSEYFGLSSTLDPEIEQLFSEYYRLLALRRLTEKQRDRMRELRVRLENYNFPGATRRERRLLGIIDRDLAIQDNESDHVRRARAQAAAEEQIAR